MRKALDSFTLRGKATLVAGLTALVAGMLLGQPALTYFAVVALTLLLLTWWLMRKGRFQLALRRHVQPNLVSVAQPAQVTLELTRQQSRRFGTLLLEEVLPYALGSRPRFVLGSQPQQPMQYHVSSDRRGRYQLGPLTVRSVDPIGLVETSHRFTEAASLWVAPHTIELVGAAPLPLASARGEQQTSAFATGSPEDVTVREYRQGDDLRRIHWPSSARTGDLMVRNEEQPWQANAAIAFDHTAGAHPTGFETAVSIAASVWLHLHQLGYAVHFAGRETDPEVHEYAPTLQWLIELEPERELDFRVSSNWGSGTEVGVGLVIGVFGQLSAEHVGATQFLRQSARTAWGVVVGDYPNTVSTLSSQGWRVAQCSHLSQLPKTWKKLAQPR